LPNAQERGSPAVQLASAGLIVLFGPKSFEKVESVIVNRNSWVLFEESASSLRRRRPAELHENGASAAGAGSLSPRTPNTDPHGTALRPRLGQGLF